MHVNENLLNSFSLLTLLGAPSYIPSVGRADAQPGQPGRDDGDDQVGFDQVVDRLRQVVERLERGNLGLEESLRAYEEGVGLARRGHELLDGAEKRVELLMRGARGDKPAVTAPLDDGYSDGDQDELE